MKAKRKSVYVLSIVNPEISRSGRKGSYVRSKNGFNCLRRKIGVFSSVEKAEVVIRELATVEAKHNIMWNNWKTCFGFILDEHFLDDALYGKDDTFISNFESRRTYLSDGRLNFVSECTDRLDSCFTGNPFPHPHIKKGDVALYLGIDEIIPVLVETSSITKLEWAVSMQPGIVGDISDDTGLSFTAHNGHIHPFSPMLFPLSCLPYVKILKRDLESMKRMREKYMSGEAL